MIGWMRVGFGGKWGLARHSRSFLWARAGVELHETAILGMLEAQKGAVDGYKVFYLENQDYRNSVLEEKKPKKKISCI